jgi:dihydroorotate dehydrogenase electron transfer subunit
MSARVLANGPVAAGFGLLRLEAPPVAREAKPGQFVMVRLPGCGFDPLLRRAFAVHYVDPEAGWFEMLYAVVGRGTGLLAGLRPHDSLDLLGPLGRGFDLDLSREPLLVAGGVGAAPLLFLAQEIRRCDVEARLFYGCRTAEGMVRAESFRALGVEVVAATEDGSAGRQGLVTDILLPALMSGGIGPPQAEVYACGPKPMLAAVSKLCRATQVPCQVSLHAFMGCGIGACLGCAVTRRGEPGRPPSYAKVCLDGPVFDAEEVDLDG